MHTLALLWFGGAVATAVHVLTQEYTHIVLRHTRRGVTVAVILLFLLATFFWPISIANPICFRLMCRYKLMGFRKFTCAACGSTATGRAVVHMPPELEILEMPQGWDLLLNPRGLSICCSELCALRQHQQNVPDPEPCFEPFSAGERIRELENCVLEAAPQVSELARRLTAEGASVSELTEVGRVLRSIRDAIGPEDRPEMLRCEYTVQAGDDLTELLVDSDTNYSAVLALNGGHLDWSPGQKVILPRSLCFYLAERERERSAK